MSEIGEQYRNVREAIDSFCAEVGRDPSSVCLVAVSKTVGLEEISQVVASGAHDFGENRPDSLSEKYKAFPKEVWHFIGNVQSRKIPVIVQNAHLIHSLYKERHFSIVNEIAEKLGKRQKVLLEVNVSGEQEKGGMDPCEVVPIVRLCQSLPCVEVVGLMTMAPQGDRGVAQKCFEQLARIRDKARIELGGEGINVDLRELSMGMSEDWREAVGAGATIVRIGRAVFDTAFDGRI